MALSQDTIDATTGLLHQFEGFTPHATWDSTAYRAGYGSDTYTDPDGSVHKVTSDTVVTQAQAEADLQRRIPQFANQGVIPYVGQSAWDALPPQTQAAVLSYAYNYGSLAGNTSAAVRQAIMSGNPQAVAVAIQARGTDNGGENSLRRTQEAAYAVGDLPPSNVPQVGSAIDLGNVANITVPDAVVNGSSPWTGPDQGWGALVGSLMNPASPGDTSGPVPLAPVQQPVDANGVPIYQVAPIMGEAGLPGLTVADATNNGWDDYTNPVQNGNTPSYWDQAMAITQKNTTPASDGSGALAWAAPAMNADSTDRSLMDFDNAHENNFSWENLVGGAITATAPAIQTPLVDSVKAATAGVNEESWYEPYTNAQSATGSMSQLGTLLNQGWGSVVNAPADSPSGTSYLADPSGNNYTTPPMASDYTTPPPAYETEYQTVTTYKSVPTTPVAMNSSGSPDDRQAAEDDALTSISNTVNSMMVPVVTRVPVKVRITPTAEDVQDAAQAAASASASVGGTVKRPPLTLAQRLANLFLGNDDGSLVSDPLVSAASAHLPTLVGNLIAATGMSPSQAYNQEAAPAMAAAGIVVAPGGGYFGSHSTGPTNNGFGGGAPGGLAGN